METCQSLQFWLGRLVLFFEDSCFVVVNHERSKSSHIYLDIKELWSVSWSHYKSYFLLYRIWSFTICSFLTDYNYYVLMCSCHKYSSNNFCKFNMVPKISFIFESMNFDNFLWNYEMSEIIINIFIMPVVMLWILIPVHAIHLHFSKIFPWKLL